MNTEELETAKQSVLNSFVFAFDSPSKTLRRYVTYDYYGYPRDFIFQYQKAVAEVTRADVLRVAKQYIHPEILTKVVAGNPKAFGKPLTTLGLVKDIDLSIPEPSKPAVKVNAATSEQGRKILARAQEAVGGAEKLAGVHDALSVMKVQIQPPQGGALSATQTSRLIPPSTFRHMQELPFGKIITYSDGSNGWLVGPQGSMAMPPAVMREIRWRAVPEFLHAAAAATVER